MRLIFLILRHDDIRPLSTSAALPQTSAALTSTTFHQTSAAFNRTHTYCMLNNTAISTIGLLDGIPFLLVEFLKTGYQILKVFYTVNKPKM